MRRAAGFLQDFAAHVFHSSNFSARADKFLCANCSKAAAQEAYESVRLTVEIMKSPQDTQKLDALVLARRKEKKISEQISTELVKTFVTGLEREDIEALARGIYKIPKTAEKVAERFLIAVPHLNGVDFSRQAEMMAKGHRWDVGHGQDSFVT